MTEGDPITSRSFEMAASLFHRIKGLCGSKGIKMKDAAADAWLAWVERVEGGDHAPRPARLYSPEHQSLHDKLERILVSGDSKTIEAVSQNIEVFEERLRPTLQPVKRKVAK